MSSSPPGSKKKDKRILSGSCPDPACQARLFFPAQSSAASIECTECGQRHEQRSLLRMEEVTDPDVVLHNLLRHALLGVTGAPKKGPELVKVAGLSNYHCKLLSPTLTRYGMDRQSGQARLLSDMNQGDMFDCALLADRAFLIEREHLDSAGYGQDRSGSLLYLRDTLAQVRAANGDQERLVPVHVDGDGHCLVHAVSRALVGRELFWHALRENLRRHFASNLPRYRALFADFIDAAEWDDIISGAHSPPRAGAPRLRGTSTATFLPGLVPPDDCRDRHGDLNKPICLAWSSSAHNHYIPLVGVRGAGPPRLPNQLLPKAWGVPQELIGRYMALDEEGGCVIGGERSLGDGYLRRLVVAMDAVFEGEHGVSAALVADVHHYVDADAANPARCAQGGFKHYWAGGEYDNLPEELPVTLDWAGRVVRETVHWWQYESDAALNSNAYEVAARLVDQHFPGEFGSEPLVQKVVTSILQQTARRGPDQYRPPARESTPRRLAPPPASGEKKIRVTTSDGRQATLTLQPRTNHAELQRAIAAAFSIPPGRQRIRAGFPPRPLPPPADASDDTPVPLQHGERVSVEVLRTEEESEVNGGEEDERRTAEEERRGGDREERREERRGGDREERREESMSRAERELQDNIDLEISSLCLLATLMGEDVWSYAKKLPHLFQPGGVFYNIVKKDMGLLDGKHCSLPQLSGRVFVYSSRDDRLELCADAAGHFPIGPGVDEMAKEAGLKLPADGSPSHAGMRLGSGGVVRKKEAASAVPVFQGKGHSLGSSPATPLSEHRPITRQHSSGVDLSGSVAPPLERELVRMAPGVVTTAMRDARGLDPVAVETQRKRLQEMVWSIQASMDKHTHAQSATLQTQEQQEAEQMEEDSTPTEPMDQS
ncbi:hypothetical protein AALO_G00240050 [Alosa alosa]|uniref:ubiquitinyl hydrolase 1 n=1 Tax=Alosa alosa TaxID=278164 RepID=A0AAV6FRY9_9TELE|nr:hypothetical protein AALO_G00240050 [Alosa alosa]